MTRPPASFADRLALARAMIARGASRLPGHTVDQLQAAGAETRTLHDRLGAVLPLIEPERNWQHRTDREPSDEVRAYLLAALLGCTQLCIHLRRGGPRPAIARLPLRRVDCERCVATIYRPATGEDECDVCGADETLTFHPFAVRQGPLMLVGDACRSCAETLGIRQEAAS